MRERSINISPEGLPTIFIFLFLTLLSFMIKFYLLGATLFLLTLFISYFFRDPERIIPMEEGIVVSPADGKILNVEQAIDPYTNKQCIDISIFMSLFSVHVNRIPVKSTIEKNRYYPGKLFNASLDKASKYNERCVYIINSDNESFTVIQIAGLVARRIVCFAEIGDSLSIGERFGLIKFGSRVEIYIPKDYLVTAHLGEKVYAGESIIAKRCK